MQKNYVAVIDSGLGGISLLIELIKEFPKERFIYFGDNLNAPYGEKRKSELLSLTTFNLNLFNEYNLKAIILACNTLSLSIRYELSLAFNIPIVCVFPPVFNLSGRRNLLLATTLSVNNLFPPKNVEVMPLLNLAVDVENTAPRFNNINLQKHFKGKSCEKFTYDNVILGCTHYVFLKKQIFDHFCPKNIISGNDYTIKILTKYLNKSKSLDNSYQNEPIFIGKCAKFNQNFYSKVAKWG